MSTEETTAAPEPYSLGEVNRDSLKECLLFLSQSYPFVDEVAKEAFTAQVNGLDTSDNPHMSGDTHIPNIATEAPAETPAAEAPAETPAAEVPAETPAAEAPAESAASAPTAEEVAAAQAVIEAANSASSTEGVVTLGTATANEAPAEDATATTEGS